ncbi:prenyltransferase [Nocardia shimofusensis]|uniref:prenyltransferase n=1 Tax=Nocardia shimofusensis TaxID=228596 RepID=UPI00083497E4|nr:prenyltransferase [Nocardia shimofusensis]
MRSSELPSVPLALTRKQCLRTGESIAAAQESSGAIPWFPGGHTDPWDHVESAMALSITGFRDEAVAAYRWSARTQRPDGSWPRQFRDGVIEDANSETNFCAYLATGVWHHTLCTGDLGFAAEMWPTVRAGIEHVLALSGPDGQIPWAGSEHGPMAEALVTGCASIHHSLGCAVALAEAMNDPHPEWASAQARLGAALRSRPELFTPKDRYSMDWYYPVLGGALRGPAAVARIDARWEEFVVGNIGIRCVADRPWVTGAETCELVLALDAIGDADRAHRLFAAMQHLRESDGSYWTGLVFADGKRWPEERTTWTAAAVVLAADALSRTTPANGLFRALTLPVPVGVGA